MKAILLGLALCLTCAAAFAQDLSVSFPKNGAVFQRSGTQGTISVMGSYNSKSYSFDFRTVRATLRKLDVRTGQVIQPEVSQTFTLTRQNSFFSAGTFFSGKITVDQGWYEIRTQVYNSFFSNSAPIGSPDIRKVGVGEVFVIAGQSNAQGLPNSIATGPGVYPNGASNPSWDGVRVQPNAYSGTERESFATNNTGRIALLISQAIFNRPAPYIADMISVGSATPATRIAPLGNSLWYWAAVGECIANQYNVPVAFFNAAWEGTTITSYSLSIDRNYAPLGFPTDDPRDPDPKYKEGTPYGAIRNTLRFFGSSYGLRAILWMQGETDTQALTDQNDRWRIPYNGERRAITDANDYTNKLRAVITASRNGIGSQIPWVIAKTSFNLNTVSPTVISGQTMTISPSDRIYPGPETDQISGRRQPNPDTPEPTHFNNQGLIDAGASWCSILPGIINTAPPITVQSLGTEPQSLEISNDGHSVRAPDGASFSWVNENGGITDPNTVFSTQQTISADQNITAGITNNIPFGGETRAFVTNGAGNLIVTQAVRLPYTLVDDTGGTPTTQTCTDFSTQCSGNNSEIRNITLNVATEGDYPLTISYQSHEGTKTGIVRAGGSSQNVQFNQTSGGAFATVTTGNFHLLAGANTIGLSSGTAGGYLCFNRVCVGAGGGPNPTNCDFNITANSPSIGCNQQVTLTANCAGANCDGVNYTWSGNGINQNGQSVSFTGPGSNGQFTYTVTASRSGCSNKTANGTVNVSGCGGGGDGSLTSGSCYVIRSQKTSQLIQAMGDGSVLQQNANGQTNQIWKAEDTGNSRYKFTTQDGTSRVIKTPAGNFGQGLVLTGYTGDGFQQWAVQQNGSTGFVRVIATNNNTWDLRAAGNDPVLQLYGNTGDGFADYRSFRFETATCTGGVVNPPGGSNPSDGSYEGFFDGLDCGSGGGWVWNSSYPNQGIVLEIMEGGSVVGTVTASVYRQDLQNAGKGNGQHGFNWSVPGVLKNGQPHSLSIRVQGQGYMLNNSPRTITCSGGARVSAGGEESAGSLSVSPNPTDGRIRVRFGAVAGQAYELRLADLSGRGLHSWPVLAGVSGVDETLVIPEAVQGLVVLQVLRDGRLESKKVIVVR